MSYNVMERLMLTRAPINVAEPGSSSGHRRTHPSFPWGDTEAGHLGENPSPRNGIRSPERGERAARGALNGEREGVSEGAESNIPQARGHWRSGNDGEDGDSGDASDEVTQRRLEVSQKLAVRRQRRKQVYEQLDPEEALRRARISAANTGRSPWNKGRRHSTGVNRRSHIRHSRACVCL
jgi:hypothetical protein